MSREKNPRRGVAHRTLSAANALAIAALLLAGCGQRPSERLTLLEGPTMGTTWSVKVRDLPAQTEVGALEREIAGALERVNALMSTYREDSELSRFNRSRDTGWQLVSAETAAVVLEAIAVSELTGGAFDVTVGPLVNLWGFGPDSAAPEPPAPETLARTFEAVGYRRLAARAEPPALRKELADLYLDLSAIAKGYAVDQVAAVLERRGVANYLVEVGGELRARGRNMSDSPWAIAVERPLAGERDVQRVIPLEDRAIATSGDYRNFYEHQGVRYSHTIDPRTGRPVAHTLASVSVIAATAMRADALATALMVLGPGDGLALAEREQLAALFLVRDAGALAERMSSSMQGYLGEE